MGGGQGRPQLKLMDEKGPRMESWGKEYSLEEPASAKALRRLVLDRKPEFWEWWAVGR